MNQSLETAAQQYQAGYAGTSKCSLGSQASAYPPPLSEPGTAMPQVAGQVLQLREVVSHLNVQVENLVVRLHSVLHNEPLANESSQKAEVLPPLAEALQVESERVARVTSIVESLLRRLEV